MTVLLSYFLGFFGVDRFYLGKTRSALWKLVTFGGFGYWWLFDLILTLSGRQRDASGLRMAGYDRHKKTVWLVIGSVLGSAIVINAILAATAASFDADGPTAFGWTILGATAVGAAVAGLIWFRRRRRHVAPTLPPLEGSIPAAIQGQLDRLAELRPLYVLHASTGDEVASNVVDQMDELATNVTELFLRLRVKSDDAQRAIAQVEYSDKLSKIAGALDRDYLLDVLANPRLWEEPERRIRSVLAALGKVNAQVLDNVRQVNALSGLVFETGLDGLWDPWEMSDS